MSLPDECPLCCAPVLVEWDGKQRRSERSATFECQTSIYTGQAPRQTQSRWCEVREREYLAARVAELESENKGLRDRFSDADTERNAAQAGLKDAFIRAAKLEERIKTITDGFRREQNDIEQTCGKVLGYPRYCDDQKNFPGATEKDGVCVGEHVASSIAAELANKYRDLLARCKRLEELGAELRECAGYLGWTSSDDSDCITRAERACEAWDKEAKP